MKKIMLLAAALCLLAGCSSEDSDTSNSTAAKVTVTFSKTDNIESVRTLSGGDKAIVVASKSRTVYEAKLNGDKLETQRIFDEPTGDADEEFTNSAAINATDFAITHTKLTRSGSEITDCGGELILYDGVNKKTHRVEVGPMPDSVAVSPNQKYAITADERDSATEAWGKCPVVTEMPGISIVDLSQGYENAKVVKQIQFSKSVLGPREPEYIAIASDNDTVAVTLQDSHEVAVFSLSQILAKEGEVLNESETTIVQLPANPSGQNPWPDGITAFNAGGQIYFAIAGEWNDTIIVVDKTGKAVSNTSVTEQQVPTSFPCVDDNESPRYSPDSITSFEKNGKVYVAATLRFAGAVIVYDMTNPASPVFSHIESVGETDVSGCSKDGSTVYPEGISAGSGLIWTANEGENSVTVLRTDSFK